MGGEERRAKLGLVVSHILLIYSLA